MASSLIGRVISIQVLDSATMQNSEGIGMVKGTRLNGWLDVQLFTGARKSIVVPIEVVTIVHK